LRILVERPFGLIEVSGDEPLAVPGVVLRRVAAEDFDPRSTWKALPREERDVEETLRKDLGEERPRRCEHRHDLNPRSSRVG
jgi:hypothetical protein